MSIRICESRLRDNKLHLNKRLSDLSIKADFWLNVYVQKSN